MPSWGRQEVCTIETGFSKSELHLNLLAFVSSNGLYMQIEIPAFVG